MPDFFFKAKWDPASASIFSCPLCTGSGEMEENQTTTFKGLILKSPQAQMKIFPTVPDFQDICWSLPSSQTLPPCRGDA